jgi:RNA polymerase sigma-70 factor (ECF subfamily)
MATPAAEADARQTLARALEEYGDRLYSLALRITRDPDLAADALHDAFASALERAAGFRGESSPGTWLHRIVYNKAIDLLRQRGRESTLREEDGDELGAEDDRLAGSPSWARPPDEIFFGNETWEAVERSLDQLTPLQRAVFVLREIDGLPTDEVGTILELDPGTVRVHLHRARLRLRALLADHFKAGKL